MSRDPHCGAAVVLPCSLNRLIGQQSKRCPHHRWGADWVTERAPPLEKGGASVTGLKIEPRLPTPRKCRVWIVKIIFCWVFWRATVLMTAAVALNYESWNVRRISGFSNRKIALCTVISYSGSAFICFAAKSPWEMVPGLPCLGGSV